MISFERVEQQIDAADSAAVAAVFDGLSEAERRTLSVRVAKKRKELDEKSMDERLDAAAYRLTMQQLEVAEVAVLGACGARQAGAIEVSDPGEEEPSPVGSRGGSAC